MSVRDPVRLVAEELEERFEDDVANLDGALQVAGKMAIDWGSRTLVLTAVVEFDRVFDHIDVEVATRRWFSRRWDQIRTVDEAAEVVGGEIQRWIREAQTAER